jgi:hypothetical protein
VQSSESLPQGHVPSASSLPSSTITRFSSRTDPTGTRQRIDWPTWLGSLEPTPRAYATKPSVPGWSPARFTGDRRVNAAVEAITALVLDVDDGGAWAAAHAAFGAFAGLLHTSYSHGQTTDKDGQPCPPRICFRVILPLVRPVTPHEHARLWAWAADHALAHGLRLDPAPKAPGQFWYLPAVRPGAEATYRAERLPGAPLDPDALLAPLRTSTTPPPGPGSRRAEPPSLSARRRRGERLCARHPPAIAGQNGSVTLMKLCVALRRGLELPADDGVALVEAHYNPRCQPPWTRQEIAKKVRDAETKGSKPWGYLLREGPETARGAGGARHEPGERPTPAGPRAPSVASAPAPERPPTEPRPSERRDRPPRGVRTDERPVQDDARADGARDDPFEGAWQWLRERDYLRTPPTPRRWLLWRDPDDDRAIDPRADLRGTGVLPRGKVGMLAAAGGVGKTMALCQLALAVATGARWLGLHTPKAGGRVLLALAEEDDDEMHRRLHHAANAMGFDAAQRALAAENLALVPLAGKPVAFVEGDGRGNVTATRALEQLRTRLDDGEPWSLVVLDPLARFAGADAEANNAAATRFVQAIETLVTVPGGPTVLVAHHTTKLSRADGQANNAAAARGASGLTDGVRWVANLDPDGPLVAVLRFTKSNYSAPAPDLYLRRESAYAGALRVMTDLERREHEADTMRLEAEKKARSKANGATNARDHVRSLDAEGRRLF